MELNSDQIIFQEKSLFDTGVTFLGFINNHGRLKSSSSRGEIKLTKQQKEILFMQTCLQTRMSQDFNEYFDEINYILVERKNLKFVSIPLSSGILFAILPRTSNHISFIDTIKSILSNSKKENNDSLVI